MNVYQILPKLKKLIFKSETSQQSFKVYSGSLLEPKLVYHRRPISDFDQDGILYVKSGDVIITHGPIDPDYLVYLQTLGWDTNKITYVHFNRHNNLIKECAKIKRKIVKKKLAYLDTYGQEDDAVIISNQLQLPLNGNPTASSLYSSKSNFRKIARKRSLPILDGYEDLYSPEEICESIDNLFSRDYEKVVIKLNAGSGGCGQLVLEKSKFLLLNRSQKLKQIHTFLLRNKQYNPQYGAIVEQFLPNLTASVGVHGLIKPDMSYEFLALYEIRSKQFTTGVDHKHLHTSASQSVMEIGHKYPSTSISQSVANNLKQDALDFYRHLVKKKYVGYWAFDAIVDKEKYYYCEVSLRKMSGTMPHTIRHKLFPKKDICFISERASCQFFQNKSFKELLFYFKDFSITQPFQEGVFIYNIANLSKSGKFTYICFANRMSQAIKINNLVKKRLESLNKR